MKLVLFGGGDDLENRDLNQAMLRLGKKNPKVTYIPACSYESEIEFNYFVHSLSSFGVKRFLHFPVDHQFDHTLENEVLSSDIIHLGGGNTYYFLKYLRRSKILGKLKSFVENGGILTGLSAGAIIMTPNINTASFPDFDHDENEENISNLKAMNLVRLEFFPHYRNSARYRDALIAHSKRSKYPLVAAPDGSGIIIDHELIQLIGRCQVFFKGKKMAHNGAIELLHQKLFRN